MTAAALPRDKLECRLLFDLEMMKMSSSSVFQLLLSSVCWSVHLKF